MQIFSHNPRGWAMKEIAEPDRELFRRHKADLEIAPVYIHTSYLINMASPSEILREKSIDLLREELKRADALGAEYVVLHTGSASQDDGKSARERAIHALKKVFRDGPWESGLLLENTAGQRGDISSEMRELAEIRDSLHDCIAGVCIDTCHAFQAGYDIAKAGGRDLLADEVEKYFGRGAVKLIHLNDSKAGPGSHRDRHEHIGKGEIGLKGLREFITHRTFQDIPLILETPKQSEDDDRRNLGTVRRLLRK
jgi:deoxyribonuclease-4